MEQPILAEPEAGALPEAPNSKKSDEVDFRDTYVVFDLCQQSFGVEVKFVREIIDLSTIRRIPTARHDIDGIVDIRGESVPIVDISSNLNLHGSGDESATRIIVFEIQQGEGVVPVGILADRVRDVLQIPNSAIESPPRVLSGQGTQETLIGLARLTNQFIMLIDIYGVIAPKIGASSDFTF